MANFLLLYTGGSMAQSKAEQDAIMQAWGAWFGELGSSVVDGGNPFTPQAKNVSGNGTVNNGPIGELATGYSIIKADSLDAAAAAVRNCPVTKSGGKITVYEIHPTM